MAVLTFGLARYDLVGQRFLTLSNQTICRL